MHRQTGILFSLLALLVITCSRCTMEKRLYRKGWYISHHHSDRHTSVPAEVDLAAEQKSVRMTAADSLIAIPEETIEDGLPGMEIVAEVGKPLPEPTVRHVATEIIDSTDIQQEQAVVSRKAERSAPHTWSQLDKSTARSLWRYCCCSWLPPLWDCFQCCRAAR